jgi:putative hemolysin
LLDLRPATEIGQKLLASTPLYGIGRLAEKLLSIEQLNEVYSNWRKTEGYSVFEGLLKRLNIACECSAEDLAKVPEKGPVVIVSNHPFGLAEGPALASLLSRRRSDVRILANHLLSKIDLLQDYLIPVDVFGGKEAIRLNSRAIRTAIEWLRQGGLLVVFPAGEVSPVQLPAFRIADPAWKETIGRIARIAQVPVVPVYFHGTNSVAFQIAGLVHPGLRTALLPRELLDKSGRTISLSIGAPVLPRVASLLSSGDLTAYLRIRTELLQTRKLTPRKRVLRIGKPSRTVAEAGDKERLRAEVDSLSPLLASGPYRVIAAESGRLAQVLPEIGRLREVCFRAVGEGTGRSRDLDRFDQWYQHLFVWNAEREEIVSAYRIGMADTILAERGPRGLYTCTLFKFEPSFLNGLGPALELGRSFVRLEYQRDYQPLLLLWKGITKFVAAHPKYRRLFGAVSISNDYHAISRALIVEFCKARRDPEIARNVRPRHPFQSSSIPGHNRSLLSWLAEDIAELSSLIADLEPDKKGVPVLLRQYLNLGGSVLEFNLDPHFANAVDGLILVDLLKADRRLLERYMGREALAAFYQFHNRPSLKTPLVERASACNLGFSPGPDGR